MSTAATFAVELSVESVTFSVDPYGRGVVLLPDAVAACLAVAAEGHMDGDGSYFESRSFDAQDWQTRTMRTIFEALVGPGREAFTQLGLELREMVSIDQLEASMRYGAGHWYGFVVGVSGWNTEDSYFVPDTEHLCVRANLNIRPDGRGFFSV
ncbi:hypothetical protein GTY65_24465 [Streptomyces sp. SID8379]|uniref:hypothetical protein n=1 Tax=unclassified Streptomyces TaxID=2593676 RepID=UPI00036C9251|nr:MULTISPECIES: hypothetical protein [unclassified Streptomyces]MYW67197.1 hypothetical protein [Streptomyces sp. SID8379]